MPPTNPAPILTIDLRDRVAPVYAPLITDARQPRHLILFGGTRSGKSYFVPVLILLRCLRELGHCFLIVRKVGRTLHASVWALFLQWIANLGLGRMAAINQTFREITFPNGSRIMFTGIDDPEKLKSLVGITGAWIEEATELMPCDLEEIDRRFAGTLPGFAQTILTFNPISAHHWLRSEFCSPVPSDGSRDWWPRPSVRVLRTTIADNPWAGAHNLELVAGYTGNKRQVYALGEWGVLEGCIYSEWPVVESMPARWDEEFYGLDFGYNNPTACVRVRVRDQVYTIEEALYATSLTNSDRIARLEQAGVPRNADIIADSEDPAAIEDIARAGWTHIRPADKGKGSVRFGIEIVQAARVHVTAASKNILAEHGGYVWKTNPDGRRGDEPVKDNDHAMDAIRYAITWHKTRSGFGIG